MHPPDRAVFRLPFSAVAFPVLLFIISAPLATTLPILNVLFAIPLIALIYILWTRTIADAHTLKVYTLLGIRTIAWADLNGFEFRGPRWAIAVTLDGKRIRLPMIRPRDLPALAAVSGGRLSLGAPPAPDEEEPLDESPTSASADLTKKSSSTTASADNGIPETSSSKNTAPESTAGGSEVAETEVPASGKPE